MFNNNSFIDERILLVVIAIGTLLIYLFVPTPNILYKEENQTNIINFGENTDCYHVHTTEIECPHEQATQQNNEVYNEPHNLNMNISDIDKPININKSEIVEKEEEKEKE